jgi:hypothetical protein
MLYEPTVDKATMVRLSTAQDIARNSEIKKIRCPLIAILVIDIV